MSNLPVEIQRINEQEMDEIFGVGYNPPPMGYDENKFALEWNQANNKLETHLSKRWNSDIRAAANDICIPSDVDSDRMLCVELVTTKTLSKELLAIAYKAVCLLDKDYCVDFCNAWGYLEPPGGGDPHPSFNIFVSRRMIWIFSESDELFNELGLELE